MELPMRSSNKKRRDNMKKPCLQFTQRPQRQTSGQIKITPAILTILTSLLWLTGCASGPRIQTDHIPPGSSRLTQLCLKLSQTNILKDQLLCDILLSSGIKESEIKDGCIGLGRIYCCDGPNEIPTAVAFYIPAEIPVTIGDLVEIRVGHPPKNGGPGVLNTLTRVREPFGDEHGVIQRVPNNNRLWRRILYADWMPVEGWVYQRGIWNTWYKPPPENKNN